MLASSFFLRLEEILSSAGRAAAPEEKSKLEVTVEGRREGEEGAKQCGEAILERKGRRLSAAPFRLIAVRRTDRTRGRYERVEEKPRRENY